MSSAIEILGRQAIKTFSRSTRNLRFDDNFCHLKKLVDKIASVDVCLEQSLAKSKICKTPITYVEVYEDEDVTIGIFILKPGTCLPLHDHPGMHGILKVIAGTIKIQSFTVAESKQPSSLISSEKSGIAREDCLVLTEKHSLVTLSSDDKACSLTPKESNLHQITHSEGQFAAFLDVLAPPYDDPGERTCNYFREVKEEIQQGSRMSWLQRTPSPSSYSSESVPYFGPKISSHYN